MNWTQGIGRGVLSMLLVGACAGSTFAEQQSAGKGVGKGETSQQKSQQGLGWKEGGLVKCAVGWP